MISTLKFIPGKRSILRVHACLLLQILAGLLLPATVRAQVSSTGTSASRNFGSQAIGLPSAAQTLGFSVSSATTVGSVAVVTTGIANLDFANATGSTCTAQLYSSATACVVNVTFTPTAAGLRKGAVVFYSKANNAGTVLSSVPLYGNGTGPQIAYGPGKLLVIDAAAFNGQSSTTGLQNPRGMTMDAAGDLFILDDDSDPVAYRLVKVPAGGGTPIASDPTVNGESLYLPSCVAVDGAGDLFIGDFYNRVVEVPAGGGAATAIFPTANGIPLNYPSGLAVDGAGDLFIGDYLNNRVLEVPAGGGAAIVIDPTVNGILLNDPHGLAVDGVGDLFIADLANNRVAEVPADGSAAMAIDPTVDGIGLENSGDVALDAAGDLYISDNVNHRVVVVPAGGGAATAIDETLFDKGLGEVFGVAVDGAGDVFIVEGGLEGNHNIVEELQRSQPPTLTFPTLTAVGSTDTTDGTQTVQIMNIGNEPLTLTGLSYSADFPEAGGDSNACTGSASLVAGQECDVSVEFIPMNSGALNESVTLTGNALNVTGAQQSIPAVATGEALAELTSPAPGTVLPGPTVTFTWTASAAAKYYWLSVGSTGVGSSNLFNTGRAPITSCTAGGLPTNGETIYVRLTTYFNTVQIHIDYTYTAVTLAALLSPAPGTALPGSSVTFNWTAGTGATGYSMWLGSTGVGSYNLRATAETTATSVTVTGLPTNSETIYVRLYTYYNAVLAYTNYLYTAGTLAAMTSPAPGALLPGSSVTFNWSAPPGATGYSMWLGSTGVGSYNLHATAETTATSITVASLPTNSETIYVRLFTYFGGALAPTDYTYTAATPVKPISPSPGAILSSPTVTFMWTATSGATGYRLSLGSTGVGSNDVYDSGQSMATSATATGLPAKSETIYARLSTNIHAAEQHSDYTYTDAVPPVHAELASPAPGSVVAGSSATFTWTAGNGVESYQLFLGTTGAGSYNLYNSGPTTATSAGVTGLPTYGQTICARLYSEINGTWQFVDYSYTEAGSPVLATLSTPAPGTVLAGSSATFTWTAGGGVESYQLFLGTTGVGSSNLYNSGHMAALSAGATGLPTYGQTIYARLFSDVAGTWQFFDYTYTEAGSPVLATIGTPAPGSVLSGSSVAFTWTAGGAVESYELLLGNVGVGSDNLFISGATTATSASATGLPTYGQTIYARLSSEIKGVWTSVDYTYTEAGSPVPAALSTPTPGRMLSGSSATFKWTAGGGVESYQLYLGTTGAGSCDLYDSGHTAALSASVTGLPDKVQTIYARLFSDIGGVWRYTDYTYAER